MILADLSTSAPSFDKLGSRSRTAVPALADERICHVYRNRDPYPAKKNAVKWVETMDDEGTTEKQDICGLPMALHDNGYWYCVECDRPRSDWPTTPPSPTP